MLPEVVTAKVSEFRDAILSNVSSKRVAKSLLFAELYT
jgi:nitrous oxidase accessory protein NosD